MQQLTRAEEELMHKLWSLEQAFLKDLMDAFAEPKPAQSTVSTILRILQEKGFVQHEAFGRTFRYRPLITKEEYAKRYMRNFLQRYFDGSFANMLSAFSPNGDLSMQELDQLLRQTQDSPETSPDHDN